MTENDPLEKELSALRPREPSQQWRARVGEGLAEVTPRSTRRAYRVVAVIGLIAACVVAAILLQRNSEQFAKPTPPVLDDADDLPPIGRFEPDSYAAFDESLPTVWAYTRAFADSSTQLERTLHAHSMEIFPGADSDWRVRTLASELNRITGEL